MYTSNPRFGDTRSKQSKLRKRQQSEFGSGKRREDPSIHATSRPWHTSSPGVNMNVSNLAQIAKKDPIAGKYLNQMRLSELASKKRGIVEADRGRGIDPIGRAVKAGTVYSQNKGRLRGSPNADTIARWQADISGRIQAGEASGQATADLPGAQANVEPARERLGRAQGELRYATRLPLHGGFVGRDPFSRRSRDARHEVLEAQTALNQSNAHVSHLKHTAARGSDYFAHIDAIKGLKKKLPKQPYSYTGAFNHYF